MNRLQKKCAIATTGVHLLLLTLLLVGPAFFSPRPKADDIHVLTVIPATLVDAPFSSGVANAAPPPEPVVQPPLPAPVVTPPEPVKPEKEEPIKLPDKVKPAEPAKSEPHKPLISTQLVTRPVPKTSSSTTAAKAGANAARARAFANVLKTLKTGLTSGTIVDMPGSGSVAYASYKDALGSIYYDAWTPDGSISDEANTLVRITVATDGTVLDARIITPSGDAKMDASVQRTLQRVSSVPELPDKSKVQQEFTIQFNLKAKRMLE